MPLHRVECEQCGKEFERYRGPSFPSPRFCSRKCFSDWYSADRHPNWKGDDATRRVLYYRAEHWFKDPKPCACGAKKTERHHIDGNLTNNTPENIAWLCRSCHMEQDGRMDAIKGIGVINACSGCGVLVRGRTKRCESCQAQHRREQSAAASMRYRRRKKESRR